MCSSAEELYEIPELTPVEMELSEKAAILNFIAEGQKYGNIEMPGSTAGVSPAQAPIETITHEIM